jgi:hypothetical protein
MREDGRAELRPALTAALYALALAAGMIIGYLYHRLSGQVELAFVFPALAGLAGGAVIRLAARAAALPLTRSILFAALLAGGLSYAASFYFDYREFHADLAHAGPAGITLQAAQVDRIETQLLGAPGFVAYMNARAQYGGTRGALLRGTAPLSGQALWILWLGEIALAAGAGAYSLRVRLPFIDHDHGRSFQLAAAQPFQRHVHLGE